MTGNLHKYIAVIILRIGLIAGLGLAPLSAQENGPTAFVDVALSVGLTTAHQVESSICEPPLGSGVAWADYDNDGDIDLYVTNHGSANFLYRNDGDVDGDHLPNFVDMAVAASLDDPLGIGHSAVFIDIDNDGDQDLYITNWGGNRLFLNELIETGQPRFLDITDAAGVVDEGRANTASWADFDQDGYLDLYLSKHKYCEDDIRSTDRLFRNNGALTFSDATHLLCPDGSVDCPQLLGLGFTAGWIDLDNDADLDLYLVNDDIAGHHYPNVLWRNDGSDGNGGWLFADISAASGSDISLNGMGLGIGDYDNDGWLDLAFSNVGPNYLLRNSADGTFEDVSSLAGIQRTETPEGRTSITWGTVFFDYDNDRWQDLYIVAGPIFESPAPMQPNAFFHNNGDGTFSDSSVASGLDDAGRGRAAAIADFDQDGYVDVFVGNFGEAPLLYHNRSRQNGNTFGFLTVTVEGTRSNRDGIGTRLWLTTPDGLTQMREISSGATYGGGDYRAAYFGMGEATEANLTVRWPGGDIQVIGSIVANQQLHLVEPTQALPAVTISLDIAAQYDPVPTAGDTFPVQMSMFNHTQAEQGLQVWMTLRGPDNITREVLLPRNLQIPPFGSFNRSPLLRIAADGPDGLYELTGYCGTAGSDTLYSFTVPLQKGAAAASVNRANGLSSTPDTDRLFANYPNPFNPETNIPFQLSRQGRVRITIYDLQGRRICRLLDESRPAGIWEVRWNGRNEAGLEVGSGVYLYRLEGPGILETRQMLLLR